MVIIFSTPGEALWIRPNFSSCCRVTEKEETEGDEKEAGENEEEGEAGGQVEGGEEEGGT